MKLYEYPAEVKDYLENEDDLMIWKKKLFCIGKARCGYSYKSIIFEDKECRYESAKVFVMIICCPTLKIL